MSRISYEELKDLLNYTTSTPVSEMAFPDTAYTGQPMTVTEEVTCAKCGDGLVGLRSTGWFDNYVDKLEYPKGAYVHYKCLSQTRLQEIKDQA